MLRLAKRKLAAPYKFHHTHPRSEIVCGVHQHGMFAVSVHIPAGASGRRAYVDPQDLIELANELLEAAAWLGFQSSEEKGVT